MAGIGPEADRRLAACPSKKPTRVRRKWLGVTGAERPRRVWSFVLGVQRGFRAPSPSAARGLRRAQPPLFASRGRPATIGKPLPPSHRLAGTTFTRPSPSGERTLLRRQICKAADWRSPEASFLAAIRRLSSGHSVKAEPPRQHHECPPLGRGFKASSTDGIPNRIDERRRAFLTSLNERPA
jgi:hypothetical protein